MAKFEQSVIVGKHRFLADEPVSAGGNGSGPNPYDYLLAGLGACTSMTIRLYADFKKLPLKHVAVRLKHDKIHAVDCENCETKEGKIDRIDERSRWRAISLWSSASADGDCRQVPGAPHADIGNRYPHPGSRMIVIVGRAGGRATCVESASGRLQGADPHDRR